MHRLRCAVQNYEWGLPGASSAVARLHHASSPADIQARLPYAELWMGTHPSGPSHIQAGAAADSPWTPLQAHLTAHPSALGPAGLYSAESALPFLLKVLSVGKALSVQAHPDRELAARLHAARPDLYKDANHKPEMAIALTPFEAMCSFRAPGDLAARLRATPELRALAGAGPSDALLAAADAMGPAAGEAAGSSSSSGGGGFRAALQAWYAALMAAPPAEAAQQAARLGARLEAQGEGSPAAAAAAASAPPPVEGPSACGAYELLRPDAIAARLLAQYPGDIGVFAPYFLNTLRLPPGGALFLGSGEPHAYLAGDCIEVMACSDNVVRAGLTPKFKDTATLVGMLTYSCTGRPAVTAGAALPPPAPRTRLYTSPVPEFQVQATRLPCTCSACPEAQRGGAETLPGSAAPSILIVVEGGGSAAAGGADAPRVRLAPGDVWFVPAGLQLTLFQEDAPCPSPGAHAPCLRVYRAMANDAGGSH